MLGSPTLGSCHILIHDSSFHFLFHYPLYNPQMTLYDPNITRESAISLEPGALLGSEQGSAELLVAILELGLRV